MQCLQESQRQAGCVIGSSQKRSNLDDFVSICTAVYLSPGAVVGQVNDFRLMRLLYYSCDLLLDTRI